MGAGLDNETEIVDGVRITVTRGSSKVVCRQIENCDHDSGNNVSTIIGIAGVIGNARAAGGHTVTLQIRRAKNARNEVPWPAMEQSGEVFRIDWDEVGGERFVFRNCQVAKISSGNDNAGNVTMSVNIVATKRESLGNDNV